MEKKIVAHKHYISCGICKFIDSEFSHEIGSEATNKITKDKAKKQNAPKNIGKYKA